MVEWGRQSQLRRSRTWRGEGGWPRALTRRNGDQEEPGQANGGPLWEDEDGERADDQGRDGLDAEHGMSPSSGKCDRWLHPRRESRPKTWCPWRRRCRRPLPPSWK